MDGAAGADQDCAPSSAGAAIDESHFQLLLHAARSQPEPQRLLFVFAAAALPDAATAEQRSRFAAGEGGELAPVMCVDKDPHALTTFAALAAESRYTGQPWQVVFVVGCQRMVVACGAGRNGNDAIACGELGIEFAPRRVRNVRATVEHCLRCALGCHRQRSIGAP